MKLLLLLFSFFPAIVLSQTDMYFRAESFASIANGSYTPFWIASNTYGIVPINADNSYFRGQMKYKQTLGRVFNIDAGIDLVTASNHTSSLWLHQFYAGISYRKLKLTVGSKEYFNSILDRALSQGDMCYSGNSRPHPEILLGFPEYTDVPFTGGILAFKADFAVGKSLDDDYILRTKSATSNYATGVLIHHKSLFFKVNSPVNTLPLFFTAGLVHASQWGGWVSGESVHYQPASIKDFLRIVMCSSGGDNATGSDRINVLGNHLGTINIRLDYAGGMFGAALYKQHYFDDKSGLEYANWRDGIWGGEISFPKSRFIDKIVLEMLYSKHQSGPFHFIMYDNRGKYRGGGNDDYYNNGAYYQGWSYFGRSIGNPLLTSPEYNGDGDLKFKNNRIKSFHAGIKGNISQCLSYRVLLTSMSGWGRMSYPFLKRNDNFSFLTECLYTSSALRGWELGFQVASDNGDLYGNNFGCSFKISKHGLLINK
ncbi:MAG: capsule assembly Wzi family protein [Dysgonamonadaceae bacterium]|jgi:hypothetical protein|nr:capsule assembly Wzi family protein [Dysgonamonadaceae bacterium]